VASPPAIAKMALVLAFSWSAGRSHAKTDEAACRGGKPDQISMDVTLADQAHGLAAHMRPSIEILDRRIEAANSRSMAA
jgi:hypothetical protein